MKKIILVTLLLPGLFLNISYSCTTAFFNNNDKAKVVARTVDLFIPDMPTILVYPRGMMREGEAGPNSLKWKSKYGSVVVTEFNTSAASDGVNEHGLAAHLLYLTGSSFEKRDEKIPALSNTLWAQYILDNYKTVEEVIESTDKFQLCETMLHNKKWPLHLSIQDASGDAAVIEFIDGKKIIYHGHQYTVMTNEPAYKIQLENLKKYKPFGGNLALPGDSDPLSRFVRVSSYLKTLPSPKDVREAVAGVLSVIRTAMVPFGAIDTSGNETEDAWATRWVSVIDLTHKTFYFNTTITPNIIWLDLNKLDFHEERPVLYIDPNNMNLVGDVKNLMKQK
ncbi:linear amide C-N hydrolase [Legionella sp. km772]|uniref:linear amide C-N hydrolase n=1 Tax=Legionella sp. km772 TaxID=2498111 RepID=UPI000F8EA8F4|nr:linear amide C-N hydrolase [Legionella sp. km772]RUR07426.1 linear amide C-N hydrolase [Legionella sp. km772]